MRKMGWLEANTKDPTFRSLLNEEDLVLEVTEKLYWMMQRAKLTKAQLAARLQRSPAFVTQILNGDRNMTLRTVADVARACGFTIKLRAKSGLVEGRER
jgi:transcriptional regulator with XRE-family HTH domain